MNEILKAIAEFLNAIFGPRHAPSQSEPIDPKPLVLVTPPPATPNMTPVPVTPKPVVKPAPDIDPKPKVESHWWRGTFPLTQNWGCTSLAMEGHNPLHPECQYFHEGLDFGLPCGTPVYAARALHVMDIDPPGYGGSGVYATFLHGGNNAAIQLGAVDHDVWLYHMHDYAVKKGDHLEPGALIGHSGTRGFSTGCHIHFEVRPAGAAYRHSIDPHPYL